MGHLKLKGCLLEHGPAAPYARPRPAAHKSFAISATIQLKQRREQQQGFVVASEFEEGRVCMQAVRQTLLMGHAAPHVIVDRPQQASWAGRVAPGSSTDA